MVKIEAAIQKVENLLMAQKNWSGTKVTRQKAKKVELCMDELVAQNRIVQQI
jgi:hypothetical protein